jgi:peptide/nickel transport system substrate-binding protein
MRGRPRQDREDLPMRLSDPVGIRRLIAAGVALVGLASLGGCSVFGDAQEPAAHQPVKGGTLHVLLQAPLDILDPQRNQAAIETDVLRLMTRTLTTYRSVPGQAASEIVPDLATDTGRPSDNKTVWSFTLKPGMKWEERRADRVLADQVRHRAPLLGPGQRRPDVPGRLPGHNATPYEGPWVGDNNGGKGLSRSSARTSGTSRSS